MANITLGSSAASVTFSSISQAYRDLVLVSSPIGSTASNFLVQVNSDTTNANYSIVNMRGNGFGASSGTTSGYPGWNVAFSSSVLTTASHMTRLNIMDYSATDKHKSVLIRTDNTPLGEATEAEAGRWANTAAVTTLTCITQGSTFVAGSTFALYGIAA
jgi:hypothetical protein